MKSIWKISGIFIGIGFIFIAIGLLLGADRYIYADANGVHAEDTKSNSNSIKEHNLDIFKDIDITSDFSNIEFIKSDNYGLEIYYNSNVKPTWIINNGKLEVNYNSGQSNNKFFNLDLSFNSMENVIKIYYPENATFNDCIVKNSSGKITIDALNAQNLKINDDYGNVSISNSKLNGLDVTMSSGSLKLYASGFQNVSAENKYGEVNGDDITTSNLNITSSSGNIVLNGDLSGITVLHCDYGNITLGLLKPENNYSYDIWTNFGNIVFGGKKENGTSIKKTDASLLNNLNVSTQSGSIRVDFNR